MLVGGKAIDEQAIAESAKIHIEDRRRSRLRVCFRKISEFLFSQVGLCALVFVYAILGGFVFKHLEKANELNECNEGSKKYNELEKDVIGEVWAVSTTILRPATTTTTTNDTATGDSSQNRVVNRRASAEEEKEQAEAEYRTHLRKFRARLYELDYSGVDCNKIPVQGKWTFAGSMLFAVTVFTTIGNVFFFK